MSQKFYFHIGLPKTGTTSIQDFLELNEDVLREHNLLRVPHWLYEEASNMKPRERSIRFIEEHLGEGRDFILSNEGASMVLSEEPERLFLQERFPSLELHIIVYLRRQDVLFESSRNQMICCGVPVPEGDRQAWFGPSSIPFFPFLGDRFYDFASWLEPLARTVGQENMHVRVFEPDRFKNGDLIEDFLDVLGIPFSDTFKRCAVMSNPSLDVRFTQLYGRQLAMFPDLPSVGRILCEKGLLGVNALMGKQGNKYFTSDERKRIMDMFRESNEKVAASLMGSKEALFSERMPSEAPPPFSREELELIPMVLNRLWYEAVARMDYGTYNTIKLRHAQDGHKKGDASASKEYRRRKLINSLGKLFSKGFYSHFKSFFPSDLSLPGKDRDRK
ncbi:hypothetical protein [uncultured Pseudodesulfovibrio sp.]|uniref:hypothetical protein n=1 Tax=uncultured Pseudodesulfovibrio sp. TaxID=2035858 RepID=UPI0029C8763C|nr:hypothetical protein [uncultured Pseudodesulfovibrio sp.]